MAFGPGAGRRGGDERRARQVRERLDVGHVVNLVEGGAVRVERHGVVDDNVGDGACVLGGVEESLEAGAADRDGDGSHAARFRFPEERVLAVDRRETREVRGRRKAVLVLEDDRDVGGIGRLILEVGHVVDDHDGVRPRIELGGVQGHGRSEADEPVGDGAADEGFDDAVAGGQLDGVGGAFGVAVYDARPGDCREFLGGGDDEEVVIVAAGFLRLALLGDDAADEELRGADVGLGEVPEAGGYRVERERSLGVVGLGVGARGRIVDDMGERHRLAGFDGDGLDVGGGIDAADAGLRIEVERGVRGVLLLGEQTVLGGRVEMDAERAAVGDDVVKRRELDDVDAVGGGLAERERLELAAGQRPGEVNRGRDLARILHALELVRDADLIRPRILRTDGGNLRRERDGVEAVDLDVVGDARRNLYRLLALRLDSHARGRDDVAAVLGEVAVAEIEVDAGPGDALELRIVLDSPVVVLGRDGEAGVLGAEVERGGERIGVGVGRGQRERPDAAEHHVLGSHRPFVERVAVAGDDRISRRERAADAEAVALLVANLVNLRDVVRIVDFVDFTRVELEVAASRGGAALEHLLLDGLRAGGLYPLGDFGVRERDRDGVLVGLVFRRDEELECVLAVLERASADGALVRRAVGADGHFDFSHVAAGHRAPLDGSDVFAEAAQILHAGDVDRHDDIAAPRIHRTHFIERRRKRLRHEFVDAVLVRAVQVEAVRDGLDLGERDALGEGEVGGRGFPGEFDEFLVAADAAEDVGVLLGAFAVHEESVAEEDFAFFLEAVLVVEAAEAPEAAGVGHGAQAVHVERAVCGVVLNEGAALAGSVRRRHEVALVMHHRQELFPARDDASPLAGVEQEARGRRARHRVVLQRGDDVVLLNLRSIVRFAEETDCRFIRHLEDWLGRGLDRVNRHRDGALLGVGQVADRFRDFHGDLVRTVYRVVVSDGERDGRFAVGLRPVDDYIVVAVRLEVGSREEDVNLVVPRILRLDGSDFGRDRIDRELVVEEVLLRVLQPGEREARGRVERHRVADVVEVDDLLSTNCGKRVVRGGHRQDEFGARPGNGIEFNLRADFRQAEHSGLRVVDVDGRVDVELGGLGLAGGFVGVDESPDAARGLRAELVALEPFGLVGFIVALRILVVFARIPLLGQRSKEPLDEVERVRAESRLEAGVGVFHRLVVRVGRRQELDFAVGVVDNRKDEFEAVNLARALFLGEGHGVDVDALAVVVEGAGGRLGREGAALAVARQRGDCRAGDLGGELAVGREDARGRHPRDRPGAVGERSLGERELVRVERREARVAVRHRILPGELERVGGALLDAGERVGDVHAVGPRVVLLDVGERDFELVGDEGVDAGAFADFAQGVAGDFTRAGVVVGVLEEEARPGDFAQHHFVGDDKRAFLGAVALGEAHRGDEEVARLGLACVVKFVDCPLAAAGGLPGVLVPLRAGHVLVDEPAGGEGRVGDAALAGVVEDGHQVLEVGDDARVFALHALVGVELERAVFLAESDATVHGRNELPEGAVDVADFLVGCRDDLEVAGGGRREVGAEAEVSAVRDCDVGEVAEALDVPRVRERAVAGLDDVELEVVLRGAGVGDGAAGGDIVERGRGEAVEREYHADLLRRLLVLFLAAEDVRVGGRAVGLVDFIAGGG